MPASDGQYFPGSQKLVDGYCRFSAISRISAMNAVFIPYFVEFGFAFFLNK